MIFHVKLLSPTLKSNAVAHVDIYFWCLQHAAKSLVQLKFYNSTYTSLPILGIAPVSILHQTGATSAIFYSHWWQNVFRTVLR